MFRSGNPALKADTFTGVRAFGESTMTLEGSVNKTGISLLVLIATAALQWNGVFGELMPVAMLAGVIGGFVVALVTVFKKEWSPVTTPLYAALEGLALGGISLVFEARYPGIVINAVGLTFGTLGGAAARLPLRPHPRHRELQARHLRRDGRHRDPLSRLHW